MLKKAVLAAMIAASTLVALPASAQDPIPPCWNNCVWISTDHNLNGTGGGGYWICEVQMDCVNP